MKKKISLVTATRAEYGLLRPIILALKAYDDLDVKLLVTGAHLSTALGNTYQEIEGDGIRIDRKIDILLSSDSPAAISKSMGLAMISFGDYFAEETPDLLVVLGDRYESLAVVIAAMNQRIPIAHLYGGETTEGAIDEGIRHAITKLSYLHFTSTAEYRRRVIQLGEDPARVYNVGAIGIENIRRIESLSKRDLGDSLGLPLDRPYAIGTFHPVTLEEGGAEEQMKELLEACLHFSDMDFIFTKANADTQGMVINQMLDVYKEKGKNIFVYASLGMKRYLSALKYAEFVIGNSSSGLVEAPSFKIPTIDIGDRQKGRLRSTSVLHCQPKGKDIENAINEVRSQAFKSKAKKAQNPYGDGETSEKIIQAIRYHLFEKSLNLKKKFFDLEVEA